MIGKNKILDNTLYIIIYSILPVISTILITFILLPFSNMVENFDILMTYITMILSFIFVPLLFLKMEGINFGKFEIKKDCIRASIMFSIGFIITMIISYFKYGILERKIFVLAFQIIPVAISEEFWARLGFFKLLEKFRFNSIYIIILSSVAFGFLIHFNRPFTENLIFRFTGGLLLGVAYFITKKIEVPILIHFFNNLLGGL